MEKNEKGFLMSYPDEVVGVVSSHSGAREYEVDFLVGHFRRAAEYPKVFVYLFLFLFFLFLTLFVFSFQLLFPF